MSRYLDHLSTIRSAEVARVVAQFHPPGARVLEIGAGTGQQAAEFARRGFDVAAIDVPASNYRQARVFPITDYDGRHIPFEPASFDIVFSSSVLEHVADLKQLNGEIGRVLRPDGYCVHVMPTHAWRLWTSVSAFPAAAREIWSLRGQLLPRARPSHREFGRLGRSWLQLARHCARPFVQRRHGERGTALGELWLFHPRWWRRAFRRDGFEVVRDEPMGLFYTGNTALGHSLPLRRRESLAAALGSACHLFVVRPRRG